MGRTKNQIIDSATDTYIANLDLDNPPDPETIAAELIQEIEAQIILENQLRTKGTSFRIPENLSFDQIAQLMSILYPISRIACAGTNADSEYDLLAIYQTDGPDAGTYVTSEEALYKLARQFNRRLLAKHVVPILISSLLIMAFSIMRPRNWNRLILTLCS